MRRARVAYARALHDATEHPAGLRLADGRVLAEDAVVWLPPFEVGTVIALGLNYADHVKELSKELTVTAKDASRRRFSSRRVSRAPRPRGPVSQGTGSRP